MPIPLLPEIACSTPPPGDTACMREESVAQDANYDMVLSHVFDFHKHDIIKGSGNMDLIASNNFSSMVQVGSSDIPIPLLPLNCIVASTTPLIIFVNDLGSY